MARRRYYRSRRTIPKQKWLLNMCNVSVYSNTTQTTSISGGQSYLYTMDIISNTTNTTQTTNTNTISSSNSTILKTGRWKCKGIIVSGFEALNYMVGIMYIPEGYTITSSGIFESGSVMYKHPEWVLCWKRFDYSNAGQSNDFSLTSRLKRNLNSGDRIVMFLLANNASGSAVNINANTSLLKATVTYVCRTN